MTDAWEGLSAEARWHMGQAPQGLPTPSDSIARGAEAGEAARACISELTNFQDRARFLPQHVTMLW